MVIWPFKSKFFSRCKVAMEKIKKRIEMGREREMAVVRLLKQDVIEFLESGFDFDAYLRAGHLQNKLNHSSCHDCVEKYCDHLLAHLTAMDKQKDECLEECVEAVASLMFAAARFSGLPELSDLRAIFTARYGKPVELFVDQDFVNKLALKHHSWEVKIQLMQAVASENGFEWDSSVLAEKLQKAPTVASPASTRNRGHVHPKMPEYEDVVAHLDVGIRKKLVILRRNKLKVEPKPREVMVPCRKHVHPKMPEYDDFRAHLEALRETARISGSRTTSEISVETEELNIGASPEMEKMKVLVRQLALAFAAQKNMDSSPNMMTQQISSFDNINNHSQLIVSI